MSDEDDRLTVVKEGLISPDGEMLSSGFNKYGQEIPDPVPLAVPVKFPAQLSLAEEIRRAIFTEQMRNLADQRDFDTPEEADDLDVPDDPLDPQTPWEAEYEASQERLLSRRASVDPASGSLRAKREQRPTVASDSASVDTGKGVGSSAPEQLPGKSEPSGSPSK